MRKVGGVETITLEEYRAIVGGMSPDGAKKFTEKRPPKKSKESEAGFQKALMDLLKLHGWMRCHFRPALTQSGGWATAVEGDIGFPDIVAAKDPWLLILELKSRKGKCSPEQFAWLRALGLKAMVARPQHWPYLERFIKYPAQVNYAALGAATVRDA